MKKLFVLLLIAFFSIGLAGCGQEQQGDPETLIIQFVPSTSVDSTMLTRLKGLEDMLQAELENQGYAINVNISIGTSYASVVEAMASGQVHVGFLTAQQYAFTTLEYPGKVEVLLTSVRSAYNAQIDPNGNAITDPNTIIANSRASGYDGSLHPTVQVSSYYAMLLVRTSDFNNGLNTVAALAGKTVASQSDTSGSGYLYPSFLLHENNLKWVTGTPNAANGEVRRQVVGGHQNSVLALLNNEVDATFTFFDARTHATAYNSWIEANPGKNIFEETTVLALTTGIFNDTISSISSLSPGLKAAIQAAFMAVIQTDDGYAALQIYNHTGYQIAVDSDYDGERAFYLFLQSLQK